MTATNDEIRIGVVGTGKIGNGHLKRYADIPGARVVAVCDINEAAARAAASEHGVADVYTDYHQMLARPDIQAVDVCLHNQLHRPVSIDAMQAGKDVYCEKPIAATYADGLAMVQAAERTGQRLHVQIGTIFSPAVRVAREMVDAGRLGEIYHGRAYVNLRHSRPFVDGRNTAQFVRKETAGGGALIDWGIYVMCKVLWLMGNPKPTRSTGQTYDKIPMDPARRAEARYDVEEMGCGFVHFDNGATLDVLAAWAMNLDEQNGCAVAGTKGGVMFPSLVRRDDHDLPPRFFSAVADPWVTEPLDLEAANARWAEAGLADAYDSPQHHWVRVQQGKVELLPTARIALNMILIAEGVYRSVELGREVTTEEVLEMGRAESRP